MNDADLIRTVQTVVEPVVQLARRHGPLPPLRSTQFLNAPQEVKLAVLLVAGSSWALGDLLGVSRAEDYAGGRFHRPTVLPVYTELQRRRYPPTGNRELWIRWGPAGPPAADESGAAA